MRTLDRLLEAKVGVESVISDGQNLALVAEFQTVLSSSVPPQGVLIPEHAGINPKESDEINTQR